MDSTAYSRINEKCNFFCHVLCWLWAAGQLFYSKEKTTQIWLQIWRENNYHLPSVTFDIASDLGSTKLTFRTAVNYDQLSSEKINNTTFIRIRFPQGRPCKVPATTQPVISTTETASGMSRLATHIVETAQLNNMGTSKQGNTAARMTLFEKDRRWLRKKSVCVCVSNTVVCSRILRSDLARCSCMAWWVC